VTRDIQISQFELQSSYTEILNLFGNYGAHTFHFASGVPITHLLNTINVTLMLVYHCDNHLHKHKNDERFFVSGDFWKELVKMMSNLILTGTNETISEIFCNKKYFVKEFVG